ncbi:MAG TPA: hypothetical protein PK624_13600 [Spirochaetota bacterium]|nr:hypothetical protein [Spirochaetota bacterium]HOR45823.1 hypothetical protein [Spirochaetota bacterium]HPK57537.1 hypothetical protein [Spirochaetota bacterium]
MKVLQTICFLCLFSIGCTIPENIKKGWLESDVSKYPIIIDSVEPNNSGVISEESFSDSNIDITWNLVCHMKEMNFILKNKTDKTMTIDWNKVVFVNHTKLSKKVIHTGVKFVKKDELQTPSIIVKDSMLIDSIVPIDNITFKSEDTLFETAGWKIIPVLEPYDNNNSLVGKKFKVLLPIAIGDKTVEYLFTFKVTKKEPEKK